MGPLHRPAAALVRQVRACRACACLRSLLPPPGSPPAPSGCSPHQLASDAPLQHAHGAPQGSLLELLGYTAPRSHPGTLATGISMSSPAAPCRPARPHSHRPLPRSRATRPDGRSWPDPLRLVDGQFSPDGTSAALTDDGGQLHLYRRVPAQPALSICQPCWPPRSLPALLAALLPCWPPCQPFEPLCPPCWPICRPPCRTPDRLAGCICSTPQERMKTTKRAPSAALPCTPRRASLLVCSVGPCCPLMRRAPYDQFLAGDYSQDDVMVAGGRHGDAAPTQEAAAAGKRCAARVSAQRVRPAPGLRARLWHTRLQLGAVGAVLSTPACHVLFGSVGSAGAGAGAGRQTFVP
jgi:hypothetical protein